MAITSYEQAIEYIHSANMFGIKLGLDNIRYLLNLLGNPQMSMRSVHVAGTNGKGSVVSFLASILEDSGERVGKFVSPYIERFSERISVNGVEITNEALTAITEKVRVAVGHMLEEGCGQPTEFEIVTAIAFVYFQQQGCDFVVLEVGMGGRFDSTNVIEQPEISVITNVDMDHMQYLGNTLEKIAYEKAGIIKQGCPVVVSAQDERVVDVVRNVALEKNSQMTIANPMNCNMIIPPLKLYGAFQRKNAVTAMVSAMIMGIEERYIESGVSRTVWPGRLEKLACLPDFYIDGAHNPAAASVLVDSLLEMYEETRQFIFILGMMKDKDVEAVLSYIGKIANCVITVTPDNPRAMSAESLANKASVYCQKVLISDTIQEAVSMAQRLAKSSDVIIACGSLYYIGVVRSIMLENKDRVE